MAAAMLRRPARDSSTSTKEGMLWSVMGLYAAFVSETGVRYFPMQHFWHLLMGATLQVIALGAYFL